MLIDLLDQTRLPHGDCDVCVLGAGPAGIVTALELARARPDWRIVLAEGGGLAPPTPDQYDSYLGADDDDSIYPLAGGRLRFLGGTSNHWGGWCRPMDPEDFLPRPHLPLGGWPFPLDDLDDHYRRAASWCEIDSDDYRPDPHLTGLGETLLDVSQSELFCHKLFRFSPPTRFGQRYLDDLSGTDNLDCWLHANALSLRLVDGRVEAVHLASDAGLRGELRARQFVVAMGGVENARFLLLQHEQAPTGSGLASPMLGRCFADHLGFTPAQALLPANLQYARQMHDTGPVMPVLSLRPEAQQALALANVSLMPHAVADLPGLDAGYPRNPSLGFTAGDYWNYRLQVTIEPQPDPDSRVVLGDERDRFGLPRLRLDWHMHADDRRRGERMVDAIIQDLGASGLGRVRRLPDTEAFARQPTFVFHHMGTTRMATGADAGVVDADSRVHGVENLHVAGSSVFPGYGFSNPTLTIVALALRLADHLADSGRSAPA